MLEQRPVDEWDFIEVWTDATSKIPYLLLLVADGTTFKIYDPREGYKEVFSASTYEEAKLWLAEDEYELVDGRLSED
jgi:hypothetical protein